MVVLEDGDTGDLLFEHNALIVARMPKVIADKYPGMAFQMASNYEAMDAAVLHERERCANPNDVYIMRIRSAKEGVA